MDTLSLVSEYLKDLEECMDDSDSKIAKEAKLFDALEHKSVVIEVDNQKIAIFTKAPLQAFGEPFMRYSIPCKVDGQGSWDVELDLVDSTNYVTKEVLENMGFVYVNFRNYSRKMVNDVNIEIHRVKFKADFVASDYVNEEELSIVFGRDFLVTTKSQVDFGLGEIRINLTEFKEGIEVIDLTKEVGSSSEEVVKMGKANRNKSYNINKLTPPPSLRLEEIPPTSTVPPQPVYNPLTLKQNEKIKEVFDIKYKELEESKPIIEVLENYVIYKKKLDEILIGKERLNKKEFSEKDKVAIIEHGLPKKMYDPKNYVLPVKINGVVEMVALVDIRASVSVLPYSIYKDLGLSDPRPYQTNLIMANNTQAKVMREVKNRRIQICYQAYVVDLLILDIPVGLKLPLLLGRPFLRTCGAVINMGRGTLYIDDGVIRHTYFPKPQKKSYVEAFEMEGENDWLGSFEVGREEDGNVKYGPVAPSFIDIEDDMEKTLTMEAYFSPFKNKVDGDGDWHARFEIVTRSGRKFNRAFKTKTTTRKLSGKFKTKDVLRGMLTVRSYLNCKKGDLEYQGLLIGVCLKGSLVHREASRERCQKHDLWMISILEESRGVNLAWIIADHLYKHAPRTKENSAICTGHYVTRIASFLGYCVDDKIKKCLEPIDCKYYTSRMLADELDEENTCLKKEAGIPTQDAEGSSGQRQEHEDFGGSSLGYTVRGLSKDDRFNDDDMDE
nr:hypothetical protein [Tanacetum cinerariifolium]